MFKKGQSGNPGGKKKGTRNKDWAFLDWWILNLKDAWPHLKPKDKAYLSMEGFKALLKFRNLPPDTPEDSKVNADAAFKVLQEMTSGSFGESKPGTDITSQTPGMENGVSGLQAENDSAPHQNGVGRGEEAKS